MHVHGLIQPLKYIHLEVHVYFTMHDLFMVVDGACDWFPYSQSEI